MTSGVYKITAPSGNFYIGSSIDIDRRWGEHLRGLRREDHSSPALQHAANKYGIESLKFEVLLICAPEDCIFFEQRAIDTLIPKYNSCRVAGSMLGFRHSEETKAKHSVNNSRRWLDPEYRAHIVKCSTGRIKSEQELKKISASSKGRIPNDEARAKMSKAHTGAGHSESTIKEMSRLKSIWSETDIGKRQLESMRRGNMKPVVCIETGEEFESAKAAAEAFGCGSHTVSKNCRGIKTPVIKFNFIYKEDLS